MDGGHQLQRGRHAEPGTEGAGRQAGQRHGAEVHRLDGRQHPAHQPRRDVAQPPGAADDVASDDCCAEQEQSGAGEPHPAGTRRSADQQRGRPGDDERHCRRPTGAEPPGQSRGDHGAQQAADIADHQQHAEPGRRQAEIVHQEQQLQRRETGQPEVRQPTDDHEQPERSIGEHGPDSLPDLPPQRFGSLGGARSAIWPSGADPGQTERGDAEADHVEQYADGGRHHLDDQGGKSGTGDLGHRLGAEQPRVGTLQRVVRDDRRQQFGVRRPVEDRGNPGQQGHDEQLRQRQAAEPPGDRHAAEHPGRQQIRGDHHPARVEPVDPGSGRQTDQQPGQPGRRREQSHPARAGVEVGDREQRQQYRGGRVPEQAGRLADPESVEVAAESESCRAPTGAGRVGRHGRTSVRGQPVPAGPLR